MCCTGNNVKRAHTRLGTDAHFADLGGLDFGGRDGEIPVPFKGFLPDGVSMVYMPERDY